MSKKFCGEGSKPSLNNIFDLRQNSVNLLVAVHSSGFPGTRLKETLKLQMHTPEIRKN